MRHAIPIYFPHILCKFFSFFKQTYAIWHTYKGRFNNNVAQKKGNWPVSYYFDQSIRLTSINCFHSPCEAQTLHTKNSSNGAAAFLRAFPKFFTQNVMNIFPFNRLDLLRAFTWHSCQLNSIQLPEISFSHNKKNIIFSAAGPNRQSPRLKNVKNLRMANPTMKTWLACCLFRKIVKDAFNRMNV